MTMTITETPAHEIAEGDFNIHRLRAAVEWAKREVEREARGEWDQTTWMIGRVGKAIRVDPHGNRYRALNIACGSTGCIAGNVCAAEGDTFVREELWADAGDRCDVSEVFPRGAKSPQPIGDRAEDLLGIEGHMAERLFCAGNSIEDVVRIATEIAASYGETL